MLEVTVRLQDDIALVALNGRFDALGAQLFEEQVNAAIAEEKIWVLDFQEVNYLSSAGIRSLIKYGKKLKKAEGEIILCSLNNDVKWVLETTGVLQLFGQAADLDTARDRINQRQTIDSSGQSFNAFGRTCTMQMISGEDCHLDIWNPSNASSLKELETGNLMAAGCDEVGLAFGIGALGSDSQSALDALGSFIAIDKTVSVMPADGYNQTDYMINHPSPETLIYLATAFGFSGPAWGKVDIENGPPVSLKELQKIILTRLQEMRPEPAPLLGMLILAEIAPGSGGYYHKYQDLIENKPMSRRMPGNQTVLLLGLGGKADWQVDEKLSLFMQQRGIKPGDEFFTGNAMVFADLLDWREIKDPGEIWRHFTDWGHLQDLLMVDGDNAITGGRAWLFIPGVIRSGQEKQLKIELPSDEHFPRAWEIITRKLYADASRVILEPLKGGFSDGKPFRVTAYDKENRRMMPTVLKLGPGELIEREIANHQQYVHNYILNNATTIMGQASFGSASGMRFNFVGISGPDSKISWLTNRYQEKSVDELIALFDQVFTSILKPWYGQPVWEMIKPYQQHNPLIRFPGIIEAAEKEMGISADAASMDCPELGISLPNPYHFLKYEYPARQSHSQLWYTGINHGDLNMQNILLDERDNVYIIDFSETGPRNIVSDFARLEPIFKLEMTRLNDDQDLLSLLEFEHALTRLNSLNQVPEFIYRGSDPAVAKAYEMICLVRKYAKTVLIFENDIIPYLLAMLEWTYPVVIYRRVTPQGKKMAVYSAALMVDQIMRIEAGNV